MMHGKFLRPILRRLAFHIELVNTVIKVVLASWDMVLRPSFRIEREEHVAVKQQEVTPRKGESVRMFNHRCGRIR